MRDWLKARKVKIDALPILWPGKDSSQICRPLLEGGVFVKANRGGGTILCCTCRHLIVRSLIKRCVIFSKTIKAEAVEMGGVEDCIADLAKRPNRPLSKITSDAMKLSREVGAHFDHALWFSELTIYNMAEYIPKIGDDLDDPINRSWDIEISWFMRTARQS